jgi:hypothetical protein
VNLNVHRCNNIIKTVFTNSNIHNKALTAVKNKEEKNKKTKNSQETNKKIKENKKQERK